MTRDPGIFDVLDGRRGRGAYPLNENHWSNILAWLLDQEAGHDVGGALLAALASVAGIDEPLQDSWKVERETCYDVNGTRRLIDLRLDFADGKRWFLENKIDPGYQDHLQVADEASLLRDGEYLIIVAPGMLEDLLPNMGDAIRSDRKIRYVSWRDLAPPCNMLADGRSSDPLVFVLLKGIGSYQHLREVDPFVRQARTLVEEKGWMTFYPDDFKAAFLERFPEVWGRWEVERPRQGQGNPHQYLTTRLGLLATRKHGFRLEKTGSTRPPSDPGWGWPLIIEYRVVSR